MCRSCYSKVSHCLAKLNFSTELLLHYSFTGLKEVDTLFSDVRDNLLGLTAPASTIYDSHFSPHKIFINFRILRRLRVTSHTTCIPTIYVCVLLGPARSGSSRYPSY